MTTTTTKMLPVLPPKAGFLLYKAQATELIGWADSIEAAHQGWMLIKKVDDGRYHVPEWMCSSLAKQLFRGAATGDAKALITAMNKSEPSATRSGL